MDLRRLVLPTLTQMPSDWQPDDNDLWFKVNGRTWRVELDLSGVEEYVGRQYKQNRQAEIDALHKVSVQTEYRSPREAAAFQAGVEWATKFLEGGSQ